MDKCFLSKMIYKITLKKVNNIIEDTIIQNECLKLHNISIV
jgi:hypothetical protein